jgi:signal recognition particle GTPase
LQEHSGDRPLSGEQLDAGILALSSSDRTVVIQGVAGAGKTTLISAIAETAKSEGVRFWDWRRPTPWSRC